MRVRVLRMRGLLPSLTPVPSPEIETLRVISGEGTGVRLSKGAVIATLAKAQIVAASSINCH
jgi:hypothetical protein